MELTTIDIDHATNRQIDKLCKRYDLKKGEAVKLAFNYMDKASINQREKYRFWFEIWIPDAQR